MRKIGIVASESTVIDAIVILNEGEEQKVKAEDLVVINNRNGNKIMAVCRTGFGSNENLRAAGFSPGIAYARLGRHPSTAKEYYGFTLDVLGDISTGKLEQNKTVIGPSSDVLLFEQEDNPMTHLGSPNGSVGYYKDHPKWTVPMIARFIPYHIGVFAVTGAGKSLLTRYQIIPFLRSSNYDLIIVDWKGSDYTPYFEAKLTIGDLALDDDSVIEYLSAVMDDFGYFSGAYSERNPIKAALETVIYRCEWRKLTSPTELRALLEKDVIHEIRTESTSEDSKGVPRLSQYGKRDIERFKRYLAKASDQELKNVMGTVMPDQIVKLAKEKHVVVVDISVGQKDEKLSVFLTIANYLRQIMQAKQELKVALVIDEGPQYCPFNPKGNEVRTTEAISELCALGRSYELCVVLLSQGISGEIGINAAVRRNLNTQFIGKIHPLDLEEAKRLLAQATVEDKLLTSLPEGDFYFLGKMNPSPVPLLIHFDLPKEAAI
jgi:DNA helicase HerA-like ATPase